MYNVIILCIGMITAMLTVTAETGVLHREVLGVRMSGGAGGGGGGGTRQVEEGLHGNRN